MAKIFFFIAIFTTLALVTSSARLYDDNPPAPSPSVDCYSVIFDMASCLSFLGNGSTDTKPDESCCSGFKTVVDYNFQCICEALKRSGDFGVELNITKALTLPSACGVSSPPVSECGIALPPGIDEPGLPPTTDPDTGNVAPAPAPKKNGASSLSFSIGHFIVIVFLVLFRFINFYT